MKGTILRMIKSKGFGFLAGDDGQEYFVHALSLAEGEFEKLRMGVTVEFTPTNTPKGLRAESVSIIS